MELIRAALLDHSQHAAARVTILGWKSPGENFDLFHRILNRPDNAERADDRVIAVDSVLK
jgi:hypothetical protein